MPPQGQKNQHVFQAPKGTKDLYPQDLAKRRYVTNAWRDAAIAHGFNEINGPTFEHLDLYTVKSGDGIVSELFSFRRAKGDTDYALRPEFTPTLARMYAAKANSLPKPTKWFSIGPYFRAERPQRGRLREFYQWNVDLLGVAAGEGMFEAEADAAVIACCVDALQSLGLTSEDVRIKIGLRSMVMEKLNDYSVPEDNLDAAIALLDARTKISPNEYRRRASEIGFSDECAAHFDPENREIVRLDINLDEFRERGGDAEQYAKKLETPGDLFHELKKLDLLKWCEFDNMVIRGLAYYTGLVFEVIADGERAIAGGGRYDGLIELFGGPKTPAVGFGMGDIVLSLLLEEKGLMPDGAKLADILSAAPISNRPDAFVITGDNEFDSVVTRTIATLRHGKLHARGTYKATRNVGKLLKEASTLNAKNVIIIEAADTCTVKNLDEGTQKEGVALSGLASKLQQ